MKIHKYIAIFSIIGLALLTSNILNKELFVDNSPKFRPYVGEYVVWRIKDTLHQAKEYAFFWDRNKPVNTAELTNYLKTNLKPISKGVRAAEEKGVSYTQYDLNNVEYIETTYRLSNGRVIKIKSPKGMPTPPIELFEGK